MTQATNETTDGPAPSVRGRGSRPRRRISVTGVLGELLITAGVLTLLYVGWQLWVGDLIYGAQRNAAGQELSEEWAQQPTPVETLPVEPSPSASAPTAAPVAAEPVILSEAADGEVFGIMHIPRFGVEYQVPMAGGVSRARTLDPIGIGHYPGTRMPGEVGNFALAGHRTTYGAPFNRIAELRIGDAIIVEVEAGWYTYRFRTLEYVTPSEVEVLLPVPQVEGAPAGSRYITLTSCSPMFSMTERIVAFGVFEAFTPRADGAPAALTDGVAA